MTRWDSAQFDGRERPSALQETIRQQVVDVDLELPESPEQVHATVDVHMLGRVQVCTVDAMPTVVRRSSRAARADSDPSLFVTLQLASTSMMVQHGREAVLHPGEMAVYATTSPYSLIFERGVHAHFIRFPLDQVGLPMDAINEVSARPLGLDDGVSTLAWQFLRGLADLSAGPVDTSTLAHPATDLLRAALTTLVPGSGQHGEHGEHGGHAENTLIVRIEDFIHRHLADPDLNARTVAAAHHISVRQLYLMLARAGIHLGDHLRSARLDQTRADLVNPRLRHLDIAAVGRRSGFTNASHFSREFRARFGVTPRDWRATAGD